MSASSGFATDRHAHHPLEPGTVEVGYLTDQLLRAFACDGTTCCAGVEEVLYPIARRAPLRVLFGVPPGDAAICHSPVTDWVGECNLSNVFPLPRYMWTPQGRHGSKLRTVRMMSMPLKCSRSFSSKIG